MRNDDAAAVKFTHQAPGDQVFRWIRRQVPFGERGIVTIAQRESDWGGRLVLSPGHLLFVGPAGTANRHAHHAAQVVVGLTTDFVIEWADQRSRRRATMIGSGVPHAIGADGNRIALILVDQAVAHRAASSLHATELWPILANHEPPSLDWPAERLSYWAQSLLHVLGTDARSNVVSAPTKRTLRYIDETTDGMPRLAEAARRSGLSASRLSHVFRAEVGLPFRSFVVWARLRRAAAIAARGASLTECALAAGFSDSAHFSRVFRDHFGLPPSVVLPRIEFAWPRS